MCLITDKEQCYWLRNNNKDEWNQARHLEKNSTFREIKLIEILGKDTQSLFERAELEQQGTKQEENK